MWTLRLCVISLRHQIMTVEACDTVLYFEEPKLINTKKCMCIKIMEKSEQNVFCVTPIKSAYEI